MLLVPEVGSMLRIPLIQMVQIVNPKGEMKGSAITGPVGKEAAELWPVSTLAPSLQTSDLCCPNTCTDSCPLQRIASNSGVVM